MVENGYHDASGMTRGWKLTDKNDQTRNETQWGENVTHVTKSRGGDHLCTSGWLHFYRNPILAVLLNPIHAEFSHNEMHMWECEARGKILHDGQIKSGCIRLTTTKRIPVPEVSVEKRVEFAIRCVKHSCTGEKWNAWAHSWLNGKDRSAESARAAVGDYAYGNAYAARAAAYAAAYAANAIGAVAAIGAAVAAEAAVYAAEVTALDLIAVLRECGLWE